MTNKMAREWDILWTTYMATKRAGGNVAPQRYQMRAWHLRNGMDIPSWLY